MKTLRLLTIPAFAMLSACANDQYSDSSGSNLQSDARMASVLHECKLEALHHHMAGGAGMAAGVAGVIAGAAGALLMGIANTDDPNVYIQECMKAHGYTGTSRN